MTAIDELIERVRADPDDVGRYELAWAAARSEAASATRDWADRSGDALARQVAEALPEPGADPIALGRRHAAIAAAHHPLEDVGATASERALRARYREFADREVRPHAEAIHRQNLPIPESIIEGAAELGLFDLSRASHRTMLIATEELSAASLNAAGSLITRPEILVRALRRAGTPEQCERWLPDITSGRRMVAVAVTEPGAGSDVAGLHECTATRLEDGGGWVIEGRKRWAGFSARAELIAVLCRTGPDRHRGLSLFVVEKPRLGGEDFVHAPPEGGRLVGRSIPVLGYRGMRTYDLEFERLRVPAGALVGAEGQGFHLQMEGFSVGRLQTAGRAVGVMQAAVQAALDYARRRRVFGRPIADHQVAAATLGRMIVQLASSRRLAYRAAALMDAGGGQVEASLAKLFAARQAELVTRDALQLHGGNGYSEESAVSRYFVDARVLTIFEGAEEVLALRVIARSLLAG